MGKICSKCRIEKPSTVEYFYSSKRNKEGLRPECISCVNLRYLEGKAVILEKRKQYRLENAETISEYQKHYWRKNKETLAELDKQYRLKNKEQIAETKKQYAATRKEIIADYDKHYRLKNKEAIALYYKQHLEQSAARSRRYYITNKAVFTTKAQRRRAKKLALPASLTAAQWDEVKSCFNNRCAYCGQDKNLTLDHFIPVSKGGELSINNVLPSCTSCNSSKGAKDYFEWYPGTKYYSKARDNQILKQLNYKEKVQQLRVCAI